ncbi:hypothetical protein [Sulfitobacter geojensis]|uniref:hypothetical protein n=1 Tax=Sulfitobacter geojensis TaxID=1342299 RepID=UPI0007D8D586|nr:hypothetical protein [Sulfitobacter geojensis]OAN87126.1 hypothetical protein A8B74_04170 [Sulfitobacter geojensis]
MIPFGQSRRLRNWATSLGCAAGLMLSTAAMAQDWQGVVIGQSGSDVPSAFSDAFHAAAALRSGGLDVVQMLRDQPRDAAIAALDALDGNESAVIYLTGPLTQDGAGILLEGGPLRFDDVVSRLAAAGLSKVALLVEACPAQDVDLVLPLPQPGMEMLSAVSAAAGADCPATGARLTDLLRSEIQTDTGLGNLLAGVTVTSTLQNDLVLRAPAAPVVSLISNDVLSNSVVSLTPVSAPAANVALMPVALQTATPSPDAGEVVIFAPTPQAQQAALPRAAGLPEPSIIVGIIEDLTLASFSPAEPLGEVTSNEISYENLEARRALRAQDAALFGTLVASGAFDPPAPLLAAALQTELARMGCYSAGIDGQWGPGSRRSVGRYFDEIEGVEAVSLDPTVDLFRQIVMQDDIICPKPVAAAAQPRAASSGSSRTTSRTAAKPRATTTRRAAPKPAAKAAPKRTISGSRLGGVFR